MIDIESIIFKYDPKSVITKDLIYFITCDKCNEILFEPIQCISCGKKFCLKHLKDENNNINNNNNNEVFCCCSPKFIKSKLLEIGLEKLKFKCQLDNEGDLLLSHSELKSHYDKCKENNEKIEEHLSIINTGKNNNINKQSQDSIESELKELILISKRLHSDQGRVNLISNINENSISEIEINDNNNISYTFKKYHEHPLYLKTERKWDWKCDKCKKKFERNSICRFRCNECNYDICELCMIYYENISPIEFFLSNYNKNIGWEKRKNIIT